MSKSLNEWGRFLALVLRHKPQAVGIELDVHGWAQVEALLVAFNRIEEFNMLMLEQIVDEDSKQRFAFSEDKKRIRANQGHSVKVDVELRGLYRRSFYITEQASNMLRASTGRDLLPSKGCMCICRRMSKQRIMSAKDMESRLSTKFLQARWRERATSFIFRPTACG